MICTLLVVTGPTSIGPTQPNRRASEPAKIWKSARDHSIHARVRFDGVVEAKQAEQKEVTGMTRVRGQVGAGGRRDEVDEDVGPGLPGGDEVRKSVSAVKDVHARELKAEWARQWATRKEGAKLRQVDSAPQSSLSLSRHASLKRYQSSILTQLRTGRSHLQADLYKTRSAVDDRCQCGAVENRHHFLLTCPLYAAERIKLRTAVGRGATDLTVLLNDPAAVPHTMQFVDDTARFPRYAPRRALTGGKAGSRRWLATMPEGQW